MVACCGARYFPSLSATPRVTSWDTTASRAKSPSASCCKTKCANWPFFDPLTKLPSRRLLTDWLNQALAASRRSGSFSALIFLDLDNFKPLNDAQGHVVGDLLLVEVANRLKACVRDIDTVARFGGDEFVVLLGELTTERVE